MNGQAMLANWNDGAAKAAVVDFVEKTVAMAVPLDERIAVFDADGTLWCEKPAPVEADFVVRGLADQAKTDPSRRDRQPWKAAAEADWAWFGHAIDEHYSGDDTKAKALLGGVSSTYAGITVEDFVARSDAFLRSAQHPTLGRRYVETAYVPMLELLGYLKANGFTNLMVSGSGADFMRPIAPELFGMGRDDVIGSETALSYSSVGGVGAIARGATLGFLDDGPQKPLHIWSRLGRRPLVAGGNSNGDIPMLEFTGHPDVPALRLLVLHDDAEREFAYTRGAEKALAQAPSSGWTVVSMKDDFRTVFGTASTAPVGTRPGS